MTRIAAVSGIALVMFACGGESAGSRTGSATTGDDPDAAAASSGGAAAQGSGGAPGTGGGWLAVGGGSSDGGGPVGPPVPPAGCVPVPDQWSVLVDWALFCQADPHCERTEAQRLAGHTCTTIDDGTEGFGLTRTVGCGHVTVSLGTGYTSSSATYRQDTGEIVAAQVGSDVNGGPCDAHTYSTGQKPACVDEVVYRCEAGVSSADAGASVDAGAASFAGCRAPSEPGCGSCSVLHDTGSCTVLSSQDGVWYNIISSAPGECDGRHPTCAQCSARNEAELAEMPRRTDCDCTQDPGIDPCYLLGGCGCWCTRLESLRSSCPDVPWP